MATFLGYLAQFILTLGSQRQKEVIFATQSPLQIVAIRTEDVNLAVTGYEVRLSL